MPELSTLSPAVLASGLLVLGWLALLRWLRHSLYLLALLSFCATVLHEACHWLVGLLLHARPIAVALWPRRQGQRWIMGAVSFRNLHLANAAPVALAPLALFPLGWLLARHWLLPAYAAGHYGSWTMAGYVVACCVVGGLPSVVDVRVGALSALLYVLLGVGLWQLAVYAGLL
ncbi:hypothetical protein ACFFKC_09790 [Pseudoduganella danionis]|uniref:DUF3267 domain-containing protein n=1 Tax=Pseudoduganella danionis TaxID=1890295 RepID=A0ABW9SQM2_9BURK|nr:hypothetical protein [Pseudoduganella danionis]MTW32684.1 hypothetical protein [Pseudoduganella danionis]